MKHYRDEVAQLAEWCGANNLSLNVSKTKKTKGDPTDHQPLDCGESQQH